MNRYHSYCELCANREECSSSCHGTKYRHLMRDGLNNKAYIPMSMEEIFTESEKSYGDMMFRISKDDAARVDVPVMILEYKGKGARKTLSDIQVWLADINSVQDEYCEIYLKTCKTDSARKSKPIKAKRSGDRIYKII